VYPVCSSEAGERQRLLSLTESTENTEKDFLIIYCICIYFLKEWVKNFSVASAGSSEAGEKRNVSRKGAKSAKVQ
jgi:hypothetical protein